MSTIMVLMLWDPHMLLGELMYETQVECLEILEMRQIPAEF